MCLFCVIKTYMNWHGIVEPSDRFCVAGLLLTFILLIGSLDHYY